MKNELLRLQHADSVKKYPNLSLKENEYVVLAMTRTKVGVTMIWVGVAIAIVLLSILLIFLSRSLPQTASLFGFNEAAIGYLWLAVVVLYILIFLIGLTAQTVYKSNKMYITNRRVIQDIRVSLFANSRQIIELAKIEDVSFRQNGIFDQIFKIGVFRMSTVGDETTYTFPFLDTPHDEVDIVSKLVAAAHEKPKTGK